jgi:hypothetical protein
MDCAVLWRVGCVAACAGWLLTVLLALRLLRLLRAEIAAPRPHMARPEDDTLPMSRVDLFGEERGAANGDSVISDATEPVARAREQR